MAEPKLLDQYRERLRVKHYSLRTEDAYLHWARRFIYFHGKRHPREMGGPEVEAFLSHLATEGRVASSTQNQALAALLFLYREVLQKELPWMDGMVRAKRPARVPVVLTEGEVRALLGQLDGTRWLATSLLYATGMRLIEGLRLRVKDVDFERREMLNAVNGEFVDAGPSLNVYPQSNSASSCFSACFSRLRLTRQRRAAHWRLSLR